MRTGQGDLFSKHSVIERPDLQFVCGEKMGILLLKPTVAFLD